MSRYADPNRCPDCRAPLAAPPAPRPSCPACGLPLEGATAVELYVTLQRADTLVATLRAAAIAAGRPAVGSLAAPAAPVTAPDYGTPPAGRVPVPSIQRQAAGPRRQWTVPGVLLALGGLCLVVAALVFLAVAWSVLGVGGRTAVLVALTAVATAGAWFGARRGLRAAAETFAAVAGLFLALDLAGAATAGWFGDAGASTSTLVGALVVAVVPAVGNALIRRLPAGLLVAPQAVAAGGVIVAAGAALERFADHATSTASVALVLAVLGAEAARRTGQTGLAIAAALVGVLLWVLLVLGGLGQVVDAWITGGRGGADWTDVEPVLVAAGFAVAAVAVSTVLGRGASLRQVAAVAPCWLLPGAVAAVLGDSVTVIVLVAVAAAVVVAGLALVLRSLAAGLGVALLGLAAVGGLGAASAAAVLVAGVGESVADQVSAGGRGLLVRADLAPFDADVAAPWTLPLATAVLAVALVVVLRQGVGPRSWRPVLAVGFPAVAATVLCYAPLLVAAVAGALVTAALQVLPRVRPWAAQVAWPLAAAWAVAAGLVAVYDPVPATAVAAVAAATAIAQVVRTGSLVGQLAAPPLVAAAAAASGWLVGAPGPWIGAAVVAAVAVTAALLGTVEVVGPVALVTAVAVMPLGAVAAGGDADAWVTAYLSLAGAGAAAAGIRHRSRPAAWTSAALGLAAAWVRLAGVGVETPEAYTLPLAAVLLGFGGWALWREPRLGTLRTLAPGLAAALVPSLVVTAHDPASARALLLGAACAVLVAVGAAGRLGGPLVCGAAAGAGLVVVEVAPFHDAVPRWALLSIAGLCLVVAGVRWEHLATLGRRGWGSLRELG